MDKKNDNKEKLNTKSNEKIDFNIFEMENINAMENLSTFSPASWHEMDDCGFDCGDCGY